MKIIYKTFIVIYVMFVSAFLFVAFTTPLNEMCGFGPLLTLTCGTL